MNALDEIGEEVARDVVEGVERGDGVELPWLQLERGEVGLDEIRARDVRASARDLLRGDVDAGDAKPLGEELRIRDSGPAAELEDARSVVQPRGERITPRPPRVVDDPVAPLEEAVADRVVPALDDSRSRIRSRGYLDGQEPRGVVRAPDGCVGSVSDRDHVAPPVTVPSHRPDRLAHLEVGVRLHDALGG